MTAQWACTPKIRTVDVQFIPQLFQKHPTWCNFILTPWIQIERRCVLLVQLMKLLLQFRKLVLHIQEKTYVQLPKSPEDYEISITIDESSQARVALPKVFNYGAQWVFDRKTSTCLQTFLMSVGKIVDVLVRRNRMSASMNKLGSLLGLSHDVITSKRWEGRRRGAEDSMLEEASSFDVFSPDSWQLVGYQKQKVMCAYLIGYTSSSREYW